MAVIPLKKSLKGIIRFNPEMTTLSEKIKRLARYVRDNPDDSFSKFALALELLKNNQVEKALTLFESIYKNDPGYLGTYYHLGKLYQDMDRKGDAERMFREGAVLAAQNHNPKTLSELNEALEELREADHES